MRLSLMLDMAVDGFGQREIIGRAGSALTPVELRSRAEGGAAVLHEKGADALLYVAVNGPAFPIAMFAAARAGVPLVPINYRLGGDQLAALLARHPGAYAIADDAGRAALAAAGIEAAGPDEWSAITAERDDAVVPDEPSDPDQTAVIIYTSGTTSEPKGVLLRHSHLVSYVVGSVEFACAEPEHAALVSVPPYHIAAVASVISNVYSGRRTVVLERFGPEEWLETARAEKVTNALVVPTMLARITDSDCDKSVPHLRALAYGGAPMPAAVIERALRTWPDVGFVNAYGLTETSSTIAVLGPDDHRTALDAEDPRVRARLSSVGKVLPTVEIEIRDDDGRPLPAGVPGRICVRGRQVSAEYAGIGRAVDEQGFFDTRDQGHVDEDGYLFVGGRVDDTIIRGAENIAPAEIEDVLMRHPAVAEAVVIGVPDEEWGQRIEAVVVTRPGAEPGGSELRAHVRSSLRSSKAPERIRFWPELPRTETGKLVRREVLARVLEDEIQPA
ncbi:fatty acid--CoA ligase family protein [Actinomadura sp. B10D3]|uniref:class I adenylate-forming enzyme family protein n=1 Tax=Actinomadura sp. B10D3 TaxID=3153557 RepID=UPI00325DACFA